MDQITPASQPRVLVAEDDELTRRLYRRALVRAGLEVECCENGRQAMERLAETPMDVLVTDITMPDADGLELLAWVQAHQPWLRRLVVTGGQSIAVRQQCFALGVERYLRKPIRLNELLRHLRCDIRALALQK